MAKKLDVSVIEDLVAKGLFHKAEGEGLLKEIDLSGQTLSEVLVRRGFSLEKDLLQIVSSRMNIALLDIRERSIEKAVLDKVPVKIALYYRFLPLEIKERLMTIVVSYPPDTKIQDEIRTQLGYDLLLALAPEIQIQEALKKYYGFAADTIERISAASMGEKASAQMSSHDSQGGAVEDIEKLAGDASVIKLVNQIIIEGFKKRATDIHIEPYRQGVALRYRIDGLLYDSNVSPEIKNFLNAIISRIKIMSNLNIVERRLPQDGRAVVRVQEQVLDLRISTMPTPYGESVVIRILPTQMLFSLEKLGLVKRELVVFEKLVQKPHGIIFVTGPTGSGKTTTLYACLSRINTKDRKIITIEDPIEYEMQGITQIQVMPEIGLDFSRGLRSILRHDPDVIMVGEVRDFETAEIAIRVALTGHLVFSTLHTNDASSGVTRLIDIGVEPYLLASSVEAFIAQRLIRTICNDCKYEDLQAPAELKQMIAADLDMDTVEKVKLFRGKGCASCNYTGFFGRTAIYEILLVDEKIKELIVKKTPSETLKRMAVSQGMRTLRQDGWQKALNGITTPEEVMKVTSVEEVLPGAAMLAAPLTESNAATVSAGEKRAYPRLAVNAKVHYRVFKSEHELLKRGIAPETLSQTKDISAGGIAFVSAEQVMLGSILDVRIEFPDSEDPIECLARVVRIEEQPDHTYVLAVCFLDITSADRARLNKNIEGGAIR